MDKKLWRWFSISSEIKLKENASERIDKIEELIIKREIENLSQRIIDF